MIDFPPDTDTNPDACWNWTGFIWVEDPIGNPQRLVPIFYFYGEKRGQERAVRTAYKTWVGDIPKGYAITQTCMNPLCMRPEHLRLVTRGEAIIIGRKHYRKQK